MPQSQEPCPHGICQTHQDWCHSPRATETTPQSQGGLLQCHRLVIGHRPPVQRSRQDFFFARVGNPHIWNYQNWPVLLPNTDTSYPNSDTVYLNSDTVYRNSDTAYPNLDTLYPNSDIYIFCACRSDFARDTSRASWIWARRARHMYSTLASSLPMFNFPPEAHPGQSALQGTANGLLPLGLLPV